MFQSLWGPGKTFTGNTSDEVYMREEKGRKGENALETGRGALLDWEESDLKYPAPTSYGPERQICRKSKECVALIAQARKGGEG
jgi:hypothetical protein